MRQTYAPSLAPDGSSIAYLVREGGYPYAVRRTVDDEGVGTQREVRLPTAGTGPVTRVLHSPDGEWIACEVSPRGSERLNTWIVPTDGPASAARMLHTSDDVKTTLVEWDGSRLAMDAVTADGVTEARSVDPRSSTYRVLDRRTDSLLVAAEGGHALMRVGPRGSRELLLTTPDGRWLPLLPPDPGSMTERGVILPAAGAGDEDLAILVCSDHGGDRQRILRLGVSGQQVTSTELLANPDADVDEFVISEDCSTAAVLWNQAGVSHLELLTLGENQTMLTRRPIDLPGLVASDLTITGDGRLLGFTVEGPDLPRAVEVIRTDIGQAESLDPDRTARLVERGRGGDLPELVHYTARDGLELSGWLYRARGQDSAGEPGGEPQPVHIHLHGGPEGQSRPVHQDILAALADSGVTVFTPNIRGSKGNGRAFQHADDRYGRLAAATDVADTAQFLIDARVADPDRISLGGRSYGGYLALLTGCLFPGLFAGIVDACGMTSFETYFAGTEPWLASAAYPKYGYPMHDRELLERISPLNQVHHLDSPVLFIHGDGDTNVPPSESEQMAQALRARGGEPRVLTVPGEGHQFVRPESRRLIADAILDFLSGLGMVQHCDLTRFDAPEQEADGQLSNLHHRGYL